MSIISEFETWCQSERDTHAQLLKRMKSGEMRMLTASLGKEPRDISASVMDDHRRVIGEMDHLLAKMKANKV